MNGKKKGEGRGSGLRLASAGRPRPAGLTCSAIWTSYGLELDRSEAYEPAQQVTHQWWMNHVTTILKPVSLRGDYWERATPKEGTALRHGSTTSGRVGVTRRDDAPFAHPFSPAFAHARRPPIKLEEPVFWLSTVHGVLAPQTRQK